MDIFRILAGSGDCNGDTSGAFSNTGANLAVGTIGVAAYALKAWIPFVLPIPKGVLIKYATLKVISGSDNSEGVNVKCGCEAADNPSAPTTWAQLNARTLTTAYISGGVNAWTLGTEYQFDMTEALKEIFLRPGWTYGNTLAVLFHDNGSTSSIGRQIASVENTSYTEALLEIGIISGNPAAISPYYMV